MPYKRMLTWFSESQQLFSVFHIYFSKKKEPQKGLPYHILPTTIRKSKRESKESMQVSKKEKQEQKSDKIWHKLCK